jgi:nitrate reductase gamma subunit
MFPEILFLKGIFEHNRKLWYWSFLMHQGIYWLAGSVALFILDGLLIMSGFTASPVRLLLHKILPIVLLIGYFAV